MNTKFRIAARDAVLRMNVAKENSASAAASQYRSADLHRLAIRNWRMDR